MLPNICLIPFIYRRDPRLHSFFLSPWPSCCSPSQACSRGRLPKVARLCPAGPSVFNQPNMPGCWPIRWVATWKTQWSLWYAFRENTTRSWWIKTSSQPATTLPLGLLLMEMWSQMTLRYSWSKVSAYSFNGTLSWNQSFSHHLLKGSRWWLNHFFVLGGTFP